MLKKIESYFCKDVTVYNKNNFENQPTINPKKENKQRLMRMILPIEK